MMPSRRNISPIRLYSKRRRSMAIAVERSTRWGSSVLRKRYFATDLAQPAIRHAARWLIPNPYNAPHRRLSLMRAPGVFFDELLHGVVFEREVRDDPPHSRVLIIDGAAASNLAAFHAAKFGFPRRCSDQRRAGGQALRTMRRHHAPEE